MTFLLLDNHLSFRLPTMLAPTYGTIHHVKDFGLETASDREIWDFAGQRDGVIISKDMDFYHLLNRHGPPPKLVWVRTGNATTQQTANFLINQVAVVHNFLNSDTLHLLELY